MPAPLSPQAVAEMKADLQRVPPDVDGLRVDAGMLVGLGGRISFSSAGALQTDLTPSLGIQGFAQLPLHPWFSVGAGLACAFWNFSEAVDAGVPRSFRIDLPLRFSVRRVFQPLRGTAAELSFGFSLGPSWSRLADAWEAQSEASFTGGLGFHAALRAGGYWYFTQFLGLGLELLYDYHRAAFDARAKVRTETSVDGEVTFGTSEFVLVLGSSWLL